MMSTSRYRSTISVPFRTNGMFFCTFSSKKNILESRESTVQHIVLNDSARCSFTGKEKDSETGYYYFGARYYNPDLSLWLSVDPMADKYPSLSPYNYCAWNPMKLVDPDGDTVVVSDNAKEHVTNAYKNDPNFRYIYDKLDKSNHTYTFNEWTDVKNGKEGEFDPNSRTISYMFGQNSMDQRETGFSDYRAMYEETYHAYQMEMYSSGRIQEPPSLFKEALAWKFSLSAPGTQYSNFFVGQTLAGTLNKLDVLSLAITLGHGDSHKILSNGDATLKNGKYSSLPLFSSQRQLSNYLKKSMSVINGFQGYNVIK